MQVRRHHDAPPGRDAVATFQLSDGDAGILERLHAMRAIARDAALYGHRTQALANLIVSNAPNRNVPRQLHALYGIMQRTIRFKPDPLGAEYIRTPEAILEDIQRNGSAAVDCDEISTLTAATLGAMGLGAAFAVVGRGATFTHVLPVAIVGGQAIPMDAQERAGLGNWPPRIQRKHLFRVFP